jgi:predicted RNA methylase
MGKEWHCPACDVSFKEDPHDRFYTEPEMAGRIAEWAFQADWVDPNHPIHVLEPSAGDGALVGAMPHAANITAVELVPDQAVELAARFPTVAVVTADFLQWRAPRLFDMAIMNPPYSSCPGADGMHVARALNMCRGVTALVRTNFLHGFQRYHQVFRWCEITRQVVFSRRPGFGGPADSGHGARHDYMLLEMRRRAIERSRGDVDRVKVEFWV